MYLKLAIIQSVLFNFTEIQKQTEIPKYETYQTGELKGLNRGQSSSFFEYDMDMLHIKLKKIAHASNMVANVNP